MAKRKPSTNVIQLERTIDALELMGRIEEIDAAEIQMLRSLAAACDENPNKAALWREYRETLQGVRAAGGDVDDSLTTALAQIAGAAPMGDET